ncbi:MAG: hypothetical protein PHZ14_07800 [Sulfuricella sp.]|nr:hypothetical protein [Sulfuricella sp.]
MLNEGAYQDAYNGVVRLSCPFEKAILSRCAGCDQAHNFNIAEREAIACKAPLARENCLTLHGLLHQNAAFALKLLHPGEPLPHAKELKIQCGGLLGTQQLFAPEVSTVANIHGLVGEIQQRFGSMRDVPYLEVVKAISAYEARRRR